MNNNYINFYNNLVHLTRNKMLYKAFTRQDTFSDRLVIFLFHFAFFLYKFKSETEKKRLQDLFDDVFHQIEISIREIGYGDVTVNKKMKEYVNLLHSMVKKVELWEKLNSIEKTNLFSIYIEAGVELPRFTSYFDKYAYYLSKKTFNYFTKDVIRIKF